MKTFIEDLRAPLNEVDRLWLRIPATIFITPVVIVLCALVSIYEVIIDFTIPCLKGKK